MHQTITAVLIVLALLVVSQSSQSAVGAAPAATPATASAALNPATASPAASAAAVTAPPATTTPAATAVPSDLARVMEKYTKAIGGRELLSKIHTTVSVYSFSLMGRALLVTTTTKAPSYFLQVTQVEGSASKISIGFDGRTAWLQSANGDVHSLDGEDRAEIVSEAAGGNDSEIFPDRWPTTVALRPPQTHNGKSYIVLSVKPQDGINHDLFLDTRTYQPVIERTVTSKAVSVSVVEMFGKGPNGELQAEIITTTRSDGSPPTTAHLRSLQDNVEVNNLIFAPPLGKGTETI